MCVSYTHYEELYIGKLGYTHQRPGRPQARPATPPPALRKRRAVKENLSRDSSGSQRLKDALALVDVRVLDHVIVGIDGTTQCYARTILKQNKSIVVWSTDSFTQVADVNRLLSMLPLIHPRFYPLGGPMKNFKSIELIAAEFLEQTNKARVPVQRIEVRVIFGPFAD